MSPDTEIHFRSGSPGPDPMFEDVQNLILSWEETVVHGHPPRWLLVQRILADADWEVALRTIAETDCRVSREEGGWQSFLMELPGVDALDASQRQRLARRLTSAVRQRAGGEHVFPDVPVALKRWQQEGREVTVIGESQRIEAACTRLGLAARLTAWKAARAPSLAQAQFYEELLSELKADPRETVLVSNRAELELLGGSQAGLRRCIILDRYGIYRTDGHPQFPVIPHL